MPGLFLNSRNVDRVGYQELFHVVWLLSTRVMQFV
jgi:hypothetical protein